MTMNQVKCSVLTFLLAAFAAGVLAAAAGAQSYPTHNIRIWFRVVPVRRRTS